MSSTALSTYVAPTSWEFIKQQAECSRAKGHILSLPDDILMLIFEKLHPKDLNQVRGVCKAFCNVANDPEVIRKSWNTIELQNDFPQIKNKIDERIWKKHLNVTELGLDFTGVTPINPATYNDIRAMLTRVKVEGDLGFTEVVIPKGLSLRKLEKIMTTDPLQPPHSFLRYWNPIMDALGDVTTKETCRYIISNGLLEGSRSIPEETQEQRALDLGCVIPDICTYTALLILTKLDLNTELLSSASKVTYACCQERIQQYNPVSQKNQYHNVVLGNFDSKKGTFYVDGPCGTFFGKGEEGGFGVMQKI